MPSYRLSDFDFDLPDALIAQKPAATRTASRLLHVPPGGPLVDRQFTDLLALLQPEDLLVFNNSKVIPARLHARKPTGGQVELLIERITGIDSATALLRASKKPAAGTRLILEVPDGAAIPATRPASGPGALPHLHDAVVVLGRDPAADDRFVLQFSGPVLDHLEVFGQLPLPPYIGHAPSAEDLDRYQTVYAQHAGSVAAPTAGLHFDHAFLRALSEKGIARADLTLHVGSGTFAPVRHEDLSAHRMHAEWCSLSPQTAEALLRTRARGGRVVAVGTTSLRTLESAAARAEQGLPLHGHWETSLFITPGYRFRMVDALLTNFHLPKSTLLMLVSAFAGYETIRHAYRHAIDKRYRFFSYGDAMFLSGRST
ncbi:MAG: tRNA preQ1(34) S-adenosylmethionine ribosyltransferase-isomerase QueA [Pseudomonadota bacterium]